LKPHIAIAAMGWVIVLSENATGTSRRIPPIIEVFQKPWSKSVRGLINWQ